MQIIETKVYTLDELTDEAKEKAREWYREHALDYEWYDCTYEDAKTIAALLGISINKIYFSGFYSQGDGACFEGRYEYAKGSVKAIEQHAPRDTELHALARALQKLQKRNFYKLYATVRQSGYYSHSGCTDIDVINESQSGGYPSSANGEEEALKQLLREFMDWIYKQLEKEYEWLMSDEVVDENIIANEYTFTEAGERF